MDNAPTRQRKITLTVQNEQQRTREARLIQIEQQLVQLMEDLTIENCSKMRTLLNEIIAMNPSQLEWQKHVALSTAVHWTLLDFGKDRIPEVLVDGKYHDLLVPLKKLRKKAREAKRQCLTTFKCTLEAFETAIWRFKFVQSFPASLFNLADEPTCKSIARTYNQSFQLSSNIRVVFAYAQNWTLDQFVDFTNIRQLVVEEITQLCTTNADENQLESELGRQDEYIKYIYENFMKFPEAWYWTLLSQIKCTNEMFKSEWFLRSNGIRSCSVQLKEIKHQDYSTSFQKSSYNLALQLSNYYAALLQNQARLIPAYVLKNPNEIELIEFLEEITRKKSNSTQTSTDLNDTIPNTSCALPINEQILNSEIVPLENSNCSAAASFHQTEPALDEQRDTVLEAMNEMFQADVNDICTPNSVDVAQSAESASSKEKDTVSGFLTDITHQSAGLTQTGSPITCYQKPIGPSITPEKTKPTDQSISVCVVKVEARSQMSFACDSDVEILEEPLEQIHTILDFDSTQDLIACLQTPAHILTPPIVVNTECIDAPVNLITTQSFAVSSSQEFGTSSMTSEEPAAVSQTQQPTSANTNSQRPLASPVPAPPKCDATGSVLALPRKRGISTLPSENRTIQSPKRILARQNSPVLKNKRTNKTSQLDRTQVPRHIFQPLSFAQSTKAANTATTKPVNISVPENFPAIETESSENVNSWDFESQPVICEISGKIPNRKLFSEQLPILPVDKVAIVDPQSANDKVVWNALSDPTSFASIFRKMLNSGRFDFVNRSTELNFSVALVSNENEIVLNREIFLALMNVLPAEQSLLLEIINSASRTFTYGDDLVTATDEAVCFLLLSADPAKEYSTENRSKFIHKVHDFLNSRTEIIEFCRQSRVSQNKPLLL